MPQPPSRDAPFDRGKSSRFCVLWLDRRAIELRLLVNARLQLGFAGIVGWIFKSLNHEDSKNTKTHEEETFCTRRHSSCVLRVFVSSCLRGLCSFRAVATRCT